MREIDCRGMGCPQPVVKTKQALEEGLKEDEFTIIVNDPSSSENVSRFASPLWRVGILSKGFDRPKGHIRK